MTIGDWIWIGYGIGAVLTLPYCVCTWAWGMKFSPNSYPEGIDWTMACLIAGVMNLAWPLQVIGCWLHRHEWENKLGPSKLLMMTAPKRDRKNLAKMRDETQRRRIAELERQVGIR